MLSCYFNISSSFINRKGGINVLNMPLPKRRVVDIRHKTYKLKDFVGKSDEFIRLANTGSILVVIQSYII